MYRGLFNEKIELIIKGMRRKSYSKNKWAMCQTPCRMLCHYRTGIMR